MEEGREEKEYRRGKQRREQSRRDAGKKGVRAGGGRAISRVENL